MALPSSRRDMLILVLILTRLSLPRLILTAYKHGIMSTMRVFTTVGTTMVDLYFRVLFISTLIVILVLLLIRSPLYAIIKSWVGGEGFLNRWVQEEELRPVSGDIYIWPSWLEHSVPEQKPTSNPRISISFNIFVKR